MHRIGLVVSPEFHFMEFGAITAFELANIELGKMAYDVTVLSESGGMVTSYAGIPVETQRLNDDVFDTIMFASSFATATASPALKDFVMQSMRTSRRIAAASTAAFLLAHAGVLDGRRATTHWRFARDLEFRFPKVTVEKDRIFVVDGSIWTSAGMAAMIDMVLAMIENDCGLKVARSVARTIVMYHRRSGGLSQISAMLEFEPRFDPIQKAIDYAKANLAKSLSVEDLARVSHLSPRHFSRVFSEQTGNSPAKAVELLRLEAAQLMLKQGGYSMDAIARQAGFINRDRMASAFMRVLGQTPQDIT